MAASSCANDAISTKGYEEFGTFVAVVAAAGLADEMADGRWTIYSPGATQHLLFNKQHLLACSC